jgi:hypothetical protein
MDGLRLFAGLRARLRLVLSLIATVLTLPGDPFTRGFYVKGRARRGDPQYWACKKKCAKVGCPGIVEGSSQPADPCPESGADYKVRLRLDD